jgi:hypothetical protein
VSQNISIENREKKFTSRKAAVSFVERGLAVWTSATSIRFLEETEQFAMRTARQDAHYWRAACRSHLLEGFIASRPRRVGLRHRGLLGHDTIEPQRSRRLT